MDQFSSDLQNAGKKNNLQAESIRPLLRVAQYCPLQARNHPVKKLAEDFIVRPRAHLLPSLRLASMTVSSHFAKSSSDRAITLCADWIGAPWDALGFVRLMCENTVTTNKKATVASLSRSNSIRSSFSPACGYHQGLDATLFGLAKGQSTSFYASNTEDISGLCGQTEHILSLFKMDRGGSAPREGRVPGQTLSGSGTLRVPHTCSLIYGSRDDIYAPSQHIAALLRG